MLEWVCQKCGRAVDPAFTACPFCQEHLLGSRLAPPEKVAPSAARLRRRVREPFRWSDVERGFRFGLGFVAALACAYFVLFLIAYALGHEEWLERLVRWLRP